MRQIPQPAVTGSIELILQGDLAKAAQASRQLQHQYPQQGDAWLAQVMCQLMEANDIALRQSLGQCMALAGSRYVGQLYLALQAYLAQNHEQTLVHAVAAHNLNPGLPFALIVAARSQLRLDRFTEAFHNFSKACAMFNPPSMLRIERLRCLEQIEATRYSEPLAAGAIEYLQQPFFNYTKIARLVSSLIVRQLALDTANPVTDFDTIAENPLLAMALDRLILRDTKLELLLMQVRQYLLVQLYQQTSITDALLGLASRLAMQCFYNEYVYDEVDDETQLIGTLVSAIEAALDDVATAANSAQHTHHLLAVALYRPLHAIRGIERLAVAQQNPLAQLVAITVQNPLRERELAATIPTLDTISDDISLRVKAQYEQNPYPRWISFDQLTLRKNYFEAIAGEFVVNPTHKPTHRPSATRPTRILIAGCGTGQHAISIAKRYDHVMVTAIDISMASLAYAKRMAQQYQVNNIEFMQCDILMIAALNRHFDVIESVGTLHHMQSPDDGLRALTTVLAPDGILKLGLYSKLARHSINTIRDSLTGELISQFDLQQFRHVRNRIMQHLAGAPILEVADFFCTSGCRDLLCHVHERQYTIAGLKQLLDNCGLQFQGFNFQSGRSLGRILYRQHYGDDKKMHELERWIAIEEQTPDLFADMYIFFASRR